ncbi:MAG: hypothetical protein IPH12_16190 [Saprospirales bacterium]|nr:hypothetical protein [Saprospirales bacterium]
MSATINPRAKAPTQPANYPNQFRRDAQGNPDGGLNRAYSQEKKNELLEFYLNYVKPIGSTKLDLMAGYSWQHFFQEDSSKATNTSGSYLRTRHPQPAGILPALALRPHEFQHHG